MMLYIGFVNDGAGAVQDRVASITNIIDSSDNTIGGTRSKRAKNI